MEGHKTASPRPGKGTKRRKLHVRKHSFIEPAGRGWRGYWLEDGKQVKGKVFAVDPPDDPDDPVADNAAQLAAHNDAVAHKSARLPRGGARARVTFGQAVEMVRERMAIECRPGTLKWFNDQVAALSKAFGPDRPLLTIGVDEINLFVKKRQEGKQAIDRRFKSDGAPRVSAETIRKHLKALDLIFEGARSEGVPVPYPNPVKLARKPAKPRRVERPYLTWARLQRCLADIRGSEVPSAAADADLIEFAFATGGLRRSEIARCMRADFRESVLVIDGKVEVREVFVSAPLRSLVARMLERSGGESLLPGASERLRTELVVRTFKRWAKRLEMRELRSHTIRHSVRPHLDMHGVIQTVKDFVTGHGRGIYDHADHPMVRAAFEKLWQAPPDHAKNEGSEPL